MNLLDTRKGSLIEVKKGRVSAVSSNKKFTEEYKKEIVKLVTELNKKPTEVAEDIGVTPTSISDR